MTACTPSLLLRSSRFLSRFLDIGRKGAVRALHQDSGLPLGSGVPRLGSSTTPTHVRSYPSSRHPSIFEQLNLEFERGSRYSLSRRKDHFIAHKLRCTSYAYTPSERPESRWSRIRYMESTVLAVVLLFRARVRIGASRFLGKEVSQFPVSPFWPDLGVVKLIEVPALVRCDEKMLKDILKDVTTTSEIASRLLCGNHRFFIIITDGFGFEFLSYNPITQAFTYDERMRFRADNNREEEWDSMFDIMDRIFSIILTSYLEIVQNLACFPTPYEDLRPVDWTYVYENARLAEPLFASKPTCGVTEFEHNFMKGEEYLMKSTCAIPQQISRDLPLA